MDKVTRLTLEDNTRAKLQRDKDKLTMKEIEVPSLGKALLFKRPTDEMILDYIEAAGEDASPRNMVRHYEEIIYMCCEMLQNPELHEELEVVDPIDTVPGSRPPAKRSGRRLWPSLQSSSAGFRRD